MNKDFVDMILNEDKSAKEVLLIQNITEIENNISSLKKRIRNKGIPNNARKVIKKAKKDIDKLLEEL